MEHVANAKLSDRSLSAESVGADELVSKPDIDEVSNSETAVFRSWRDKLQNASGVQYNEFRRQLKPRYMWGWIQIALAYGFVLSMLAGLVALQPMPIHWWQLALASWLAAIGIGYAVAFFGLWFHEATHYQLHRSSGWNDRLANASLGIILMMDIRKNRLVHFKHHKLFGECEDTERSYFDPLNARYMLESLTGIKVLRVILVRIGVGQVQRQADNSESGYLNWVSLAGLILHLGIICGSLYLQYYALAFAWVVGVFIFFPFFAALRQVLEHRKPDADPECDYTRVAHGAYTRVFEGGMLAKTFGGAGFNRHLIHHWDPGVSCTRFAEVERFFEQSQLGEFYSARKTTYGKTFIMLFRQASWIRV